MASCKRRQHPLELLAYLLGELVNRRVIDQSQHRAQFQQVDLYIAMAILANLGVARQQQSTRGLCDNARWASGSGTSNPHTLEWALD
jgi:ABC-type branched-subunit amino acid transport system ATPase component